MLPALPVRSDEDTLTGAVVLLAELGEDALGVRHHLEAARAIEGVGVHIGSDGARSAGGQRDLRAVHAPAVHQELHPCPARFLPAGVG